MKLDRRDLLKGSAALAAFSSLPKDAEAWLHPGQQLIGHGWNTLPLGAGGLVTGFDIAADNSIVCRTDVGNIYRWTGKTTTTTNPSDKWVPLLTFASLAGLSTNPRTNYSWGGFEFVMAPSDATKMWAIFPPLATGIISPIYYSTNSGETWSASNLTSTNTDPNGGNPPNRRAFHRIAVDPNNSSIVYVSLPPGNGQSYGTWVATDGQTFNPITALSQTTLGGGAGLCFDPSSGTTGGATNRIIIPVGGVDIYETDDAGVAFVSTGFAAALGTASFYLNCGVINSDGVYYAAVEGSGVWRYSGFGGTWENITPAQYVGSYGVILWTDPNDHTYLSASGPSGMAVGETCCAALGSAADTGTPVWSSLAYPNANFSMTAPSYDCGYLNDIFGQGSGSSYTYGPDFCCVKIDGNGDTIFCGNQSIWKITGRIVYSGSTPPITAVSFGRGQEATVAQEAYRPTGGTYALIAVQDFGCPAGGTYTNYPTSYTPIHSEYTCSSIEESPTDGTFVVARIAGQGGSTTIGATYDASAYSTNAGASFTQYATFPTLLWASGIHGSITGGNLLTVASFDSGTPIFVGQEAYTTGGAYLGTITSFGTGTGNTGTYNMGVGVTNAGSQQLLLQAANNGGQIIAADNNHHLIVAAGLGHGSLPVQTPDQGATWAVCNGLPGGAWMGAGATWAFGNTNAKPMAVGFGADVGIVWAALKTGSTTLTVYKSTDYGANFSPTANTITVNSGFSSCYLLAVPGQLGHLWVTGSGSSGLWQSTDYGDTWTSMTMPNSQAQYMSIGAIKPSTGTYPTIWMIAHTSSDPAQGNYIYYSINGVTGATKWVQFGSTGEAGQRVDLPASCQLYGIDSLRADRQIFSRLYCAGGQDGFAYYNP